MNTIGVYLESCSVFQFKVLPVDGMEALRSALSVVSWPLSENRVLKKLKNGFETLENNIRDNLDLSCHTTQILLRSNSNL